MNRVSVLLPAVAFAAAAALSYGWPRQMEHGSPSAQLASAPHSKNGTRAGGSARPEKESTAPAPSALATLALTGNPTLDDVLAASVLDRVILLARFLETTKKEDLPLIYSRLLKEKHPSDISLSLTTERWIELDPTAARRHPEDRRLWWSYALSDPKAALADASQLNPKLVQVVLYSIGQADPDHVMGLLEQHPEWDEKYLWGGVLSGLMKHRPDEAMRLGLAKGAFSTKHVRDWISRDEKAALAYVEQIADPQDRARYQDAALSALILKDPAAALDAARQLPEGSERNFHLSNALAALTRQDPVAAQKEIDTLPRGPEKAVALTSLAAALVGKDETAAVALLANIAWQDIAGDALNDGTRLASRVPSNETRAQEYTPLSAINPALRQLVYTAPLATANALAALPAEAQVPMDQVIVRWANFQPEAASSWVKALPEGPVKDRAINGLTDWLSFVNPEPDFESAMAWAASASPNVRSAMVQRTLSAWKREDPDAARAAFQALPANSIDPSEAQRLFR